MTSTTKIFKQKAGVISDCPLWICISGAYMYEGETLIELWHKIIYEWEDDKHLVF